MPRKRSRAFLGHKRIIKGNLPIKQGCCTVFRAAALFWLFLFSVRILAMAVAGGAVAAAALALPAALSGDPDHSQRKQHSQYYQRDDPAKCQHIHPSISLMQLSAPQVYTICRQRATACRTFFCAGRSSCCCPAAMLHDRCSAQHFCSQKKGFEKSKSFLN